MQMPLFDPVIIREAHLVATSPKDAFCRLYLEACAGEYWIRKESGAGDRVLDRRKWTFPSIRQAEARFNRYVKEKTNPARKSPRKYKRL